MDKPKTRTEHFALLTNMIKALYCFVTNLLSGILYSDRSLSASLVSPNSSRVLTESCKERPTKLDPYVSCRLDCCLHSLRPSSQIETPGEQNRIVYCKVLLQMYKAKKKKKREQMGTKSKSNSHIEMQFYDQRLMMSIFDILTKRKN